MTPAIRPLTSTLITCLMLSVCLNCASDDEANVRQNAKLRPQTSAKVTDAIQLVVAQLEKYQKSPQGRRKPLSTFSTSQVKVNDAGQIQCYIHLEQVTAETLVELRNRGVRIETEDKQMKVVQAWVRYQAIAALEQWATVLRISSPDYAKTLRR